MAKRKPDRIDKAAWDIALTARDRYPEIPLEKAIAALVRREVRRAVKDEHASLRAEVVRIKANLSGARNATLVDQWRQCLGIFETWLDAREAGR